VGCIAVSNQPHSASTTSTALLIGRGTAALPVGRGTAALPVGRGTAALPVGRGTAELPVGRGTAALPVGRGTTALPVGRGTTALLVGRGTTAGRPMGIQGSDIGGSNAAFYSKHTDTPMHTWAHTLVNSLGCHSALVIYVYLQDIRFVGSYI
jgi:hypothetical protein